jgi:hypothetical protein
MDWARILAYVIGLVDQELLARTEYLAAENRILKAQLKGRLKLSDAERATLGEIGHRLGRKVLGEVANMARQTPSWPAARRGYAGREQFPLLLQFFDPTPSDC